MARWTDEQVANAVGLTLRVGVSAAAAITLAGAVWFLVHQGRTHADYAAFRGEPAELRSVTAIVGSALHGRPLGVIQFGLLCLIATPIARVALSLIGFIRERDRTYIAITATVLVILSAALIGL
ncbi:MAG: DUF1634 domain-containing protein [Gemmatimonadales bacterium]